MYIDSHCHPQYLIKGDYTSSDFIEDCRHLAAYLMVAITLEDRDLLAKLASLDKRAFYSLGVHPCHTHEKGVERLESLVLSDYEQENSSLIALGETGLDYYHTQEHKSAQKKLFVEHLTLGEQTSLPVIVHTRSAVEDTLNHLKSFKKATGVIHCFTETKEFARQVLDLGWYISFSGIITFKKAEELRDVVRYCPADRILSETDAPFLAPVPFRGKDNHPKFVSYVVDLIADLKSYSKEEMASQIKKNTYCLFSKMR